MNLDSILKIMTLKLWKRDFSTAFICLLVTLHVNMYVFCVYVYMYVCMHTYTHTHIYIYIYIYIYVYMHACTYVCIYIFICICIYIYICIYVYIVCMWYVDVCGYMYMHVCVCVNICIYSFKENLNSQRVLDFSALLPVTSILTSSSQYTDSNTLRLHKITDLYVKILTAKERLWNGNIYVWFDLIWCKFYFFIIRNTVTYLLTSNRFRLFTFLDKAHMHQYLSGKKEINLCGMIKSTSWYIVFSF